MTEETPPIAIEKPKETKEREYLPLSFSREAALNAMGLIFGFIPPEKVKETGGIFRYNGDFGDTIKTLWVCTLPNRSELPPAKTADELIERRTQWTVQRAEKMPDEAYEAAQEWAQKELGIQDDKSDAFMVAYVAFLKIMQEKEKVKFTVKVEGENGAPTHLEPSDPNG